MAGETNRRGLDQTFTRLANRFSAWTGSASGFMAALVVVCLWAMAGPFVGFSDFWQLTINTGTTIVTFLMVFLVQNSQNRDTHALQIKLDELIRATAGASNSLLDIEAMSSEQIEKLHTRYRAIAEQAGKLERVAEDAAQAEDSRKPSR